jgi:mRNA-degrading endonuclease RelE of RelBE toxin-antitoxin system
MSDEVSDQQIDVYLGPTFSKVFKKLPKLSQDIVEDQIELIIENPEIGEQKKGDLAYLRVLKFPINKQEVLLGYSWKSGALEIYLLNLGSHEKFYEKTKTRRKDDLKLING